MHTHMQPHTVHPPTQAESSLPRVESIWENILPDINQNTEQYLSWIEVCFCALRAPKNRTACCSSP
jgi:hypothetical protein